VLPETAPSSSRRPTSSRRAPRGMPGPFLHRLARRKWSLRRSKRRQGNLPKMGLTGQSARTQERPRVARTMPAGRRARRSSARRQGRERRARRGITGLTCRRCSGARARDALALVAARGAHPTKRRPDGRATVLQSPRPRRCRRPLRWGAPRCLQLGVCVPRPCYRSAPAELLSETEAPLRPPRKSRPCRPRSAEPGTIRPRCDKTCTLSLHREVGFWRNHGSVSGPGGGFEHQELQGVRSAR
jgi:hypothetical protein